LDVVRGWTAADGETFDVYYGTSDDRACGEE